MAWHQLCRGRRRGIPVPAKGHLPILSERDSQVRDAGIKWYTGTFPGMPDAIRVALGPERYRRVKMRLEIGLREQKWSKGVRKRTVQSLQLVLQAKEGQSEDDDAPRARGPKRRRDTGLQGTRKRWKGI